jgi:hypothetical protein
MPRLPEADPPKVTEVSVVSISGALVGLVIATLTASF